MRRIILAALPAAIVGLLCVMFTPLLPSSAKTNQSQATVNPFATTPAFQTFSAKAHAAGEIGVVHPDGKNCSRNHALYVYVSIAGLAGGDRKYIKVYKMEVLREGNGADRPAIVRLKAKRRSSRVVLCYGVYWIHRYVGHKLRQGPPHHFKVGHARGSKRIRTRSGYVTYAFYARFK